MSVEAHAPGVVVVGSVNVDQVVNVDHRPAAGETVGEATLAVRGGGKGANQAVAAARCGAGVALIARVGDDPAGESERANIAAAGVDVREVLRTKGTPTGTAIVTVTPDAENAIVVIPGANAALSARDVRRAAPLLRTARVLLVQLEIPWETVQAACMLVPSSTIVLVNWSPAMPAHQGVLERCDVLVVNEHEATALCGVAIGTVSDALRAGAELRRLGPSAVVITLGEHGAVVVSDQDSLHAPAEHVPIVDTTGAGDAFVGSLAAFLAKGETLGEAVRYGVKAGTAATMKPGARVTVAP